MAGGLVKTVTMNIVADAGDAHAQLDDLSVKQDELAKPWSINIVADTAEATGAVDETTDALSKYIDAALEAEKASANLADVQSKDGASADELAAAQDRVAEATVRSIDAQLRLVAAEDKAAGGAVEEGDAAEIAGDKQLESGKKGEEGAGMAEKAWGVAKLAILGVAAGLAYGVVKAAGFQSSITMLNTQAGVSKSQLKMLGDGVLTLAGQVGDSPDSLSAALYHVESSFQSVGITGPKALDLLKVAAEGAATGHADLVDVTNALDSTIVAGVGGIKNYSQAMGALNAIVGSGDMTMENLAQAMGSGIMAVAKSYGQNIDQVGAALATLGDNNIRGAKAATDLRMAWQALLDPIKAGYPELHHLGLGVHELGDELTHHGLTGALQMLTDHLKDSKVPMKDWGAIETEVFGKKAGVGIGILTDQLDRLKGKLPDIEHGAKGFGSAWDATDKTLGQQWKNLVSGLEALATKMGEKLLPAVTHVVHGLTDFVEDLEKGNGWALTIAGTIGAVLAGVALDKLAGGLKTAVSGFQGLWGAGTKIVSWSSTMIGKLFAQTAATDEVTAATEAQTTATEEEAVAQGEADAAMDANPIGLVVLAIGALIIVIVEVVKHWKDFKTWALDAWHAVEDAAETAFNWIKGHWPLILTILTGPIGLAASYIIEHWNAIWTGLEHVASDIAGWFEKLPGRVLGWVSGFGSLLWNAGVNLIMGLVHGIESKVSSVVSTVEHVGSSILHGIEGALGIGSPSKEMRVRGQFAGMGLALGLTDTIPMVERAAASLATATLSGFGAGPHGAAGGGYGRGGDTYVFNVAPLTDPQKTAREIQQMLLNLKRDRGGKIDTSQGLGLA